MISKVIIGAGFGDCGKGLVTNFLVFDLKSTLVVRFSGGQQAGHTVVEKGIRHVFSNFGSGTLKGIPTYWSRFCTVDPIGIVNEMADLIKKGVDPILFIDPSCSITTPYDVMHNQRTDNDNGTCGVGVGTTWQREQDHYSLLFCDLFYPEVRNMKIAQIILHYPGAVDIKNFLTACDFLVECPNVSVGNEDIMSEYRTRVFEGSQGLMLDQNYGFFPHVTRSNTGLTNVLELTDENLDVYFVTRAYQTRHGKGPMSTAGFKHNISMDVNETNVTNKYQGEFRRGLLDVDVLRYAIMRAGDHEQINDANLVITCMDHIQNEYRFVKNGEIVICNDAKDFIRKVSSYFSFARVYASDGPESKNIKRYG